MSKIRVLVVDDSALIRNLMKEIIDKTDDMETVGVASDPLVARELIRSLDPDVITLDIEMPKMDGLDFLERLMRLRPMPVVMVSTLTERGADATFRALELGAVDFVAKPKLGITQGMSDCATEIREKIRAAATSKQLRRRDLSAETTPLTPIASAKVLQPIRAGGSTLLARATRTAGTEKIIAIGASTGGTEAIKEVLCRLPADSPAVVITQHMPPGFTKSFAERLDALCKITVKEAEHGERVLPGHAYIAPGGRHLALGRSGANYVVEISDEAPVNRHRPSVDVLFSSVAMNAGANAIGVMLTGMGKDGAASMLELKNKGAFTIAQDESSCVVFGMPREAIAIGAVEETIGLTHIADRLVSKFAEAGGHVRV
ncbi:MAG: chemotaxis response regulator protein-glutamate methylesterase [Rhodocyclaceae bacterium]|nr:chemotaxis response regulator protein-glutamate methylesterase [Rhodocyclaceae bacterium]